MHLNVLPVVVNKLQRSYVRERPVYAELQASLVGWMKLTRVHLRAHDHSVSTIMFKILDLTYFVPALTATTKEASNVVIREALIKDDGTGEEDIVVYASRALGFEGPKSIWTCEVNDNLAWQHRK